MITEGIIIAIITGGLTLAGVIASNNRKQAVLEMKIDTLSEKVNKHNSLIERTYELERNASVCGERFEVINHRLKDLERQE